MNVFCEVGMGQYGKRGAVCDAKLLVNPVQVDLDGSFGESKPLRYFLVGQTLRHHADDLAFTRGERVSSMRSDLRKFIQGLLHGMSFSTNSAGHSMFPEILLIGARMWSDVISPPVTWTGLYQVTLITTDGFRGRMPTDDKNQLPRRNSTWRPPIMK
jgi:hypothetical protein